MNTRLHIAKPTDPEGLFLHILHILERDPSFVPSWEALAEGEPWRSTPGPLKLGKATYKHVRAGEPWRRNDGEIMCHATTGEPFIEKDNEYRSTLGQGLGAIWEVTYANDGPLDWPGHEYGDEDDEPSPHDTVERMPLHLVSANFDTAYGYKSPNGAGCADLHAFLLREIGRYLEDHGVTEWIWQHEERGSWHAPHEYALRGRAELAAEHWGKEAP